MGWAVRGEWGGGRFSALVQTGSTQPHVQWVPGLIPGLKQLRYGNDHPSPFVAKIEERVELYLYSLSGPL